MTALLDVNVLLALFSPGHRFHLRAREWFLANRSLGWATCPMTQAGFVRLFMQERISTAEVSMQEACELIARSTAMAEHRFWPQTSALTEILPEIRARLIGHKQLTDAILLDLAISNGGRLVTLDRRVEHLLPANSPHRARLEVIPPDAA